MWGGGEGYAARLFLLFYFPCSADHERDWPPCKVVFFGLATNTLNVRNNNSGGCSEGLGAFRFFFKQQHSMVSTTFSRKSINQSGLSLFKEKSERA